MKKIIICLISITVIVIVLFGNPAFGQSMDDILTFNQFLLKAVSVSMTVNNEAATEKNMNKKMGAETEGETIQNNEDSESLTFSKNDFLNLFHDIEYLKAEVNYLRNYIDNNKKEIVSIDEDGFYVPEEESKSRFEELDNKVASLYDDLEKLQNERLSTANSNPSVKHGHIVFSGFVHEHYINSEDQTSTFLAKRARLGVSGEINPYTQIKIVGEFAGTPYLLDGVLTISPKAYLSMSLGQFKPPFGTDFLTSSTTMPFVTSSKAKTLGTDRDIGLSLSYRKVVHKNLVVRLIGGLFNGSKINTSDVNDDKNFVGRGEFDLYRNFTFTAGFYTGKTNDPDSTKKDIRNYSGSISWSWKNESAQFEYIYSKLDENKRYGWYLWGGHSFMTSLKFLPEIQLLTRYEQYDSDGDIDNNREDGLTIGANLYIDKKYTKIQLNYQTDKIDSESVNHEEFLVNFQVSF